MISKQLIIVIAQGGKSKLKRLAMNAGRYLPGQSRYDVATFPFSHTLTEFTVAEQFIKTIYQSLNFCFVFLLFSEPSLDFYSWKIILLLYAQPCI